MSTARSQRVRVRVRIRAGLGLGAASNYDLLNDSWMERGRQGERQTRREERESGKGDNVPMPRPCTGCGDGCRCLAHVQGVEMAVDASCR